MNHAPGIHALPSEILAKIFNETIRQRRIDEVAACLTTIASVCKYWREVAENTPSLWAAVNISPRSSPDRVLAHLARSKLAPLTVSVSCEKNTRAEDAKLIVPELHRVEDMKCYLDVYGFPESLQEVAAGVHDAPELQSLMIVATEYTDFGDVQVPFISPTSPLPKLTFLHTLYVPYEDMSLWFRPSITTLWLDEAPHESVSMSDFLDALSDMPLLEELHWCDFFHEYEERYTGDASATLPRLRDLQVADDMVAIADILDRLVFPVRALLAGEYVTEESRLSRLAGGKTSVTGMSQADAYGTFLSSVLSKFAGNGIVGNEASPAIHKLALSFDAEGGLVIELFNDHQERIFISYSEVFADTGSIIHHLASLSSEDSTRALLSGIRKLDIQRTSSATDSKTANDTLPSIDDLVTIAKLLPNLESLSLARARRVSEAFLSLHRTHPPPFPRLRTLSLAGIDLKESYFGTENPGDEEGFGKDFGQALLHAVDVRRRSDCRLHLLTIQDTGEDDFRKQLQEYVDEVQTITIEN
ncbi:hypothetical protein BXZ70DRAFT_80808 [Cristinia sonorae]|uniref:F-box domain-containing protein n=1 Tax=Cristinia sonorae TaxID=1940300 RepID=A0A8K0UQJ2_9AGAR|nr:hypothetical protein BXZ70DRAFT_80808 [Cristinia sonorae]